MTIKRAYHSYLLPWQSEVGSKIGDIASVTRSCQHQQSSIEPSHRLWRLSCPALVSESYAAPCVLAFAPPLFHPLLWRSPHVTACGARIGFLFCFRQRFRWNPSFAALELTRGEKHAWTTGTPLAERCILIDLIVHALPISVGDAMCDRASMKMTEAVQHTLQRPMLILAAAAAHRVHMQQQEKHGPSCCQICQV